MLGKIGCLVLLCCMLTQAAVFCPPDQGFPDTAPGLTAYKECPPPTVGPITRVCDKTGKWEKVIEHCAKGSDMPPVMDQPHCDTFQCHDGTLMANAKDIMCVISPCHDYECCVFEDRGHEFEIIAPTTVPDTAVFVTSIVKFFNNVTGIAESRVIIKSTDKPLLFKGTITKQVTAGVDIGSAAAFYRMRGQALNDAVMRVYVFRDADDILIACPDGTRQVICYKAQDGTAEVVDNSLFHLGEINGFPTAAAILVGVFMLIVMVVIVYCYLKRTNGISSYESSITQLNKYKKPIDDDDNDTVPAMGPMSRDVEHNSIRGSIHLKI